MQLAGDEQTRRTAIIVLVDVVGWCRLGLSGAVMSRRVSVDTGCALLVL